MRGVIAYRQDMLGSRLLNFLRAYQVTRALDVPLFLLWPDESPFFSGSFRLSDLIDATRMEGLVVIKTYDPAEIARVVGIEEQELQSLPQLRDVLTAKDGFLNMEAELCLHTATTPLAAMESIIDQDAFASLFRSLPLQGAVAEALREAGNIEISNCLALHVRRGVDIISAKYEDNGRIMVTGLFAVECNQHQIDRALDHFKHKYIPLETMRRVSLDLKERKLLDGIVLFANDADDRIALKTSLSADVFEVHEILDRHSNLTYLQRTFCEVVVMSRCKLILSSESNFSTTASTLGGAKLIQGQHLSTAEELLSDMVGLFDASDVSDEGKRQIFGSIVDTYRAGFLKRQLPLQAQLFDDAAEAVNLGQGFDTDRIRLLLGRGAVE